MCGDEAITVSDTPVELGMQDRSIIKLTCPVLDMKSKYVHAGAEKPHAKAPLMALAENIYTRELLLMAYDEVSRDGGRPAAREPRAAHTGQVHAAGLGRSAGR